MQQHKVLGDWRRFGKVKINHVTAYVKWEKLVDPQSIGDLDSDDETSTNNVGRDFYHTSTTGHEECTH